MKAAAETRKYRKYPDSPGVFMTANTGNKRVGFWLGFGILVLPVFCVWVLLTPGYRRIARILGFGWLAMALVSFASCSQLEQRAETGARKFCSSLAVGGSFEQAVTAATSEAAARKHRSKGDMGEDVLWVSYLGVPPFSRHLCIVEGIKGRISNVEYSHLD